MIHLCLFGYGLVVNSGLGPHIKLNTLTLYGWTVVSQPAKWLSQKRTDLLRSESMDYSSPTMDLWPWFTSTFNVTGSSRRNGHPVCTEDKNQWTLCITIELSTIQVIPSLVSDHRWGSGEVLTWRRLFTLRSCYYSTSQILSAILESIQQKVDNLSRIWLKDTLRVHQLYHRNNHGH